jgi:hypothetical protein
MTAIVDASHAGEVEHNITAQLAVAVTLPLTKDGVEYVIYVGVSKFQMLNQRTLPSNQRLIETAKWLVGRMAGQ